MHHRTILVIDDQPHTRVFIRTVLERQGCHVLEAGDEATAREVVEQADRPVALALIDVDLQGRDGRSVPQVLQTVPPVPVLFMSRCDRHALVANGRLPASADMLSKPLTVNALVSAVEARLGAPRHQHTSIGN